MSSTTNNPVDNLLTFCTPFVYKKQLDEAASNPMKIVNVATQQKRKETAAKVGVFVCMLIMAAAIISASASAALIPLFSGATVNHALFMILSAYFICFVVVGVSTKCLIELMPVAKSYKTSA